MIIYATTYIPTYYFTASLDLISFLSFNMYF